VTVDLIVSYFLLVINMLVCLMAYGIITNEKITISFKLIIILFCFSIITAIFRIFSYLYLYIIFNCFSIYYLQKIAYKISIKKSIYYTIIILIISLICDAAMPTILNNAYLLNINKFQNNYLFRALLIMPVSILFIFIVSMPHIKYIINVFYIKTLENNRISKLFIIFVLLIINIFVILICLNGYNQVSKIGHLITYLVIIFFFILFALLMYLFYKEYQVKVLNQNIIEENKYMKDIARKDKEFKHNLINNLLGIKTVASKKVNQLIDELISEYKTDYKNILNINDLPDGILSIIYRKAYEENIENLNLVVDNKIKKDLVDMLLPKNYNKFCTSIGILFDNALDAVKSCKEKVIEINFLEDDKYVYYIQKKSFTNVIDFEQTGTKEYTTKKSGHGIGLNYVKNLKNIETKNEVINNMFITKVKVKKIKM